MCQPRLLLQRVGWTLCVYMWTVCVCVCPKKVAVRVNKQKPQVTETNRAEKEKQRDRGRNGSCFFSTRGWWEVLLCVSFPQWEAAQRDSLPQLGPQAEKVQAWAVSWLVADLLKMKQCFGRKHPRWGFWCWSIMISGTLRQGWFHLKNGNYEAYYSPHWCMWSSELSHAHLV